MCTAQKSGHAFETIEVAHASSRLAIGSCPRGVARGGTGWPAHPRKRESAIPWTVSSCSQQARNVETSGSSTARVASSERR